MKQCHSDKLKNKKQTDINAHTHQLVFSFQTGYIFRPYMVIVVWVHRRCSTGAVNETGSTTQSVACPLLLSLLTTDLPLDARAMIYAQLSRLPINSTLATVWHTTLQLKLQSVELVYTSHMYTTILATISVVHAFYIQLSSNVSSLIK